MVTNYRAKEIIEKVIYDIGGERCCELFSWGTHIYEIEHPIYYSNNYKESYYNLHCYWLGLNKEIKTLAPKYQEAKRKLEDLDFVEKIKVIDLILPQRWCEEIWGKTSGPQIGEKWMIRLNENEIE